METIDNTELMRRYLLAQISDAERESFEARFMTDVDFQEQVLIAEEELIGDYLDDNLSAPDKLAFDKRYLASAYQQERLEVAQALRRYCEKSSATNQEAISSEAPGEEATNADENRLLPAALFSQRAVVYAAAAAVVLVVAIAGVWFLLRNSGQGFGQQFSALNRQGANNNPDLTLTLYPDTLRGNEIPGIRQGREEIVELSLVLPSHNHQNYRVTLRSPNSSDTYSVSNLEAKISGAGARVPVKVPARHLATGEYLLELSGLTANGTYESLADYAFRVND